MQCLSTSHGMRNNWVVWLLTNEDQVSDTFLNSQQSNCPLYPQAINIQIYDTFSKTVLNNALRVAPFLNEAEMHSTYLKDPERL